MRIDPTSFNPILGYKLDPGEPGLAHSAPASMSVLRVLSQELSNYLAFKKEAMREGGFIIGGGISLDLRKRGGFLAAVAGKTKVWMYIPGKNGAKSPEGGSTNENLEIGRGEILRRIERLRNRLAMTQDPMERERLEREISILEMALNGLKIALYLPQLMTGFLLDTLA